MNYLARHPNVSRARYIAGSALAIALGTLWALLFVPAWLVLCAAYRRQIDAMEQR